MAVFVATYVAGDDMRDFLSPVSFIHINQNDRVPINITVSTRGKTKIDCFLMYRQMESL